MFGQSLQYFCLECGNELTSIGRLIDIEGCHTSQECLKCGYTLLFGIIKKKVEASCEVIVRGSN